MNTVTAQRLYTDATLKRDFVNGKPVVYPAARITAERIGAWRSVHRPLKAKHKPS